MSIIVELVSYTPEPELTVALAARSCIRDSSLSEMREEFSKDDVLRLIATVISKGHHSVLEHVSFTFSISGISRVLSHQLVRHRMASYSQLSQQRVDSSDLAFVIPPEIRKNANLIREYCELMEKCQELYRLMVDEGVSKGSSRYAMPSAFTTRVLMTMNARSLFNLIEQRICAAEEWEFRQVATLIRRRLMDVAPAIFRFSGTKCETERICPEGEVGLSCGRLQATGAEITNTRVRIQEMVAH